jgi:Putative beta-barrel porin 2
MEKYVGCPTKMYQSVMKKFFVSVGLAVAGTASLQAAYAPDMGDTSKMWSISGTLRGFYDDNYATVNSNVRGSYGFEVSPQIEMNVPLQQTEIGARYIYGLYYYQDRHELDQDSIDQTHQFDLWLDHAFTEQWQIRVQDSLVMAQEPGLLTPPGQAQAVTTRTEGNNIVNTATVRLNTDWTRLFSTVLTYENSFYNYQQSGGQVTGAPGFENVNASLAGLLNRDENSASLDFEWHTTPTTTFLVGYRYDQVNYWGDEPISVFNFFTFPPLTGHSNPPIMSDARDNRSHIGYVGVQSTLTPNLSVAAKIGVQYTEDYNDPQAASSVGPYAVASLTYTYLPGCYAQIGVTHTRNATDQIQQNSSTGSIALDQESTLVYGSINHKITPKLLATLIANYQNSTYNGGNFNNGSDNLIGFGLNLNYAFTRHFSAEAGYNYDNYNSDVPGLSYSRNRVYLGITATY